jgi:hypothetical protein
MLAVYAVSYVQLAACVKPLVDNNIADRVLYRTTRVIYYAIDFCSDEDTAKKVSLPVCKRSQRPVAALVSSNPAIVVAVPTATKALTLKAAMTQALCLKHESETWLAWSPPSETNDTWNLRDAF